MKKNLKKFFEKMGVDDFIEQWSAKKISKIFLEHLLLAKPIF